MAGRLSTRVLMLLAVGFGALPSPAVPARGQQAPPLAPPIGPPEPFQPGPTPGASTDAADGPEVLTRGPVHEAFAEPVVFDPTPGVVAPRKPPEPVEELPPDRKPEGRDVAWIPGYWAWDEERDDFLWVSGIWRDIPPGRQWVPGYWTEAEGGFQWVSGFWMPLDQEDVEYLPDAPPQSLEAGPNIPMPQGDHFWSPGYWYWQDARYLWRPGCWTPVQTDWVWVPPTYAFTPAGYVFVPGYWDYALAQRGLLFAPVYIPPPVIAQPAFVYAPTTVININILTDHFFCRPRYRHYYFGDYYGPAQAYPGIQPWFAYHERRGGYDPFYAQNAALFGRRDPGWNVRIRETYRERIERVDFRPPRTFAAQERWLRSRPGGGNLPLARTLAQLEESRDARVRLERIGQDRREAFARRQDEVLAFREQRFRRETEARARIARARTDRVEEVRAARRVALPPSPVVARVPGPDTRRDAIERLEQRRRQAEAERSTQVEELRRRRQERIQAETARAGDRPDQLRQAQQERRQQVEARAAAERAQQGEAARRLQERRQQAEATQAAEAAQRQQALRLQRDQQQAREREAGDRAAQRRATLEAERQQLQQRQQETRAGRFQAETERAQRLRADRQQAEQARQADVQQRRQQAEQARAGQFARQQQAEQARQQQARQQQSEQARQAREQFQRRQQAEAAQRAQQQQAAQRAQQQQAARQQQMQQMRQQQEAARQQQAQQARQQQEAARQQQAQQARQHQAEQTRRAQERRQQQRGGGRPG